MNDVRAVMKRAKKKEKTFIDAFQNEEEKAAETFDSYTDLKNFQQF